jgi:hypothetical protein
VWIVAVITQRPEYPPTLHPAAVEKVPAINLVLEDAMRLAREFNDARRPNRESNATGLVRVRHQASGNVIYADIFPR